jgi:APA family basic amino acid/polyamine antiporter
LVTLVLTGMVHYTQLNTGDPLAYVFKVHHLDFLSGIFAASALIAMTSVLLVFQVGQPRIWMSMSRDGLLPKIFGKIHSRYKTPSFSTLLTGLMVGIPALFMNLKEVTDLCAIGTLFAFVIVCGGILVMPAPTENNKNFKVPYINGRWILLIMACLFSAIMYEDLFYFTHLFMNFKKEHIPEQIFWILAILITLLTAYKKLSLIPVLGLLTNLYLMSQVGHTNWLRFLIWLVVGLVIYFLYSWKNSKLAAIK